MAPFAMLVCASGAGTSTLGYALELEHGYKWLDTDGYFWQKTDPPFVKSLPHEERVKLMGTVIQESPKCVIPVPCAAGVKFLFQSSIWLFS